MADETQVSAEQQNAAAQGNPYHQGRKQIKYLQAMKKRGEKIVQYCPAGFNRMFTMAAELAGLDVCRLVEEFALEREGNGMDSYIEGSERTIRSHRSLAPRMHINYMMETPMYINKQDAVRWGSKLIMAGADSFLCMGISNENVRFMAENYVPTYGHVGAISGWQTNANGGYHREGRTAEEALRIFKWAYEYQEAGMGGMTIEMTPIEVSEAICKKLEIPVVGIAGGAPCDGAEMVDADSFGLNPNVASHAMVYGNFVQFACGVYGQWANDVRTGAYPQDKHGWHMDPAELEKFDAAIAQF